MDLLQVQQRWLAQEAIESRCLFACLLHLLLYILNTPIYTSPDLLACKQCCHVVCSVMRLWLADCAAAAASTTTGVGSAVWLQCRSHDTTICMWRFVAHSTQQLAQRACQCGGPGLKLGSQRILRRMRRYTCLVGAATCEGTTCCSLSEVKLYLDKLQRHTMAMVHLHKVAHSDSPCHRSRVPAQHYQATGTHCYPRPQQSHRHGTR